MFNNVSKEALLRDKGDLEREVARLRAALEPFAKIADDYSDAEDDAHEVWTDLGSIDRRIFRLSSFRAARAALTTRQSGGVAE